MTTQPTDRNKPFFVHVRNWLSGNAPLLTLLFLAPIIVDVLPGTTRLSTLGGLIPEIVTYGFAAILIRWLVRSQRRGPLALILLGIAYALAEECVFLQTSLTPTFVLSKSPVYGRTLGISWLYLLWAIGYECVWGILIPIQLVDMLFPARRDDLWFGKRGFLVTCVLFVLGACFTWYYWTQRVLVFFTHGTAPQPSLFTIMVALLMVAVIMGIALRFKRSSRSQERKIPAPWLVGTLAFLLSLIWYIPLFLYYGLAPNLPFLIPLVSGCVLAVLVFLVFYYWSASLAWSSKHSLVCITGALLASMLEGFVSLNTAFTLDIIEKVVLDLLTLIGLFLLARKYPSARSLEDNPPENGPALHR
ncbi:MAG: hypothetical protein J2P36_29485 [Ktedonobacteraceae bacterium]|nr:hypothetical protein [Ktedonobacteraceae bacterium]